MDWGQAEENVRRLRRRIFAASQAGDLKKVRNLQKLMLRSLSSALISVRRVTEINAGRRTAGVDGRVVLASWEKADMAAWLQHGTAAWRPRPVRRVYVPKSNGRRRGPGIPVIAGRALQALALSALEPEWEARFEPKSYGFRPGRGCHDAFVAIHITARGKLAKRLWVLDADLEAAFDRLSHQHILASLGSFPARELVRRWLQAGVLEDDRLTPTGEGTPQGGVISPALLNVALHGMEQAAGVRYREGRILHAVPGTPVLVRYADDLAVLCASRAQAEQVKARLAGWLEPRGLAFNKAKTKIVHLSEGFDFLGFNIRRYPNGKLLTKPSKEALRQIRRRLSAEMKALRGANADPNKPRRWVVTRYFGMFNPARRDKWVFGSRQTGFYLRKFAWTKIVRHRMVAGRASPDDPAWTGYWDQRRRRTRLPVDTATWHLLRRQRGRCPLCRGLLLHADHQPQGPEEWQQWHTATRTAIRKHVITTVTNLGTPDERAAHHLIHAYCRRRISDSGTDPALLPAPEPPGLA